MELEELPIAEVALVDDVADDDPVVVVEDEAPVAKFTEFVVDIDELVVALVVVLVVGASVAQKLIYVVSLFVVEMWIA